MRMEPAMVARREIRPSFSIKLTAKRKITAAGAVLVRGMGMIMMVVRMRRRRRRSLLLEKNVSLGWMKRSMIVRTFMEKESIFLAI